LGSIFVSYRRSDSQGEAGRLFDDLVNHFGEHMVFMDVAGIEAGRDFRKVIEQSVAGCGVLLVVIGPEWLNAKDETGARRLNDPADFVRIETGSALKRDIPVIPVLVRGAVMPRAEQLPEDVRELAYRNCIELTHARWRSDIQLLFEALRRTVGDIDVLPGRTGPAPNELSPSITAQHAGVAAKRQETSSSHLDPALMQQVTRELALCIGPIADIVVRRSASHCASVEDLYLKVAEEIDSSAEREKFLANRGVAPRSGQIAQEKGTANHHSELPPKLIEANEKQLQSIEGVKGFRPSRRRQYLLLIIGSAILLILVLIFGAPFTRSKQKSPAIGKDAEPTVPTGTPQVEQATSQSSAGTPSQKDKTTQSEATTANNGTAPRTAQRIRISQEVAQVLLISKVLPNYPPLARQARVQGTVVLAADISKNGTVEDLRALSGHPMLIPSAVEAVRQFKYKPYVLNGEPVPVSTQINVTFTLTGG
jgi:TonB family protein